MHNKNIISLNKGSNYENKVLLANKEKLLYVLDTNLKIVYNLLNFNIKGIYALFSMWRSF